MKRTILAVATLAALTACAKRPDAIAPLSMPTGAYTNLGCSALRAEHAKSSAALATVSKQQNDAATGDAVGVFLIGVPVSSVGNGDKEGLVAQHKGEVVAIDAEMKRKGC